MIPFSLWVLGVWATGAFVLSWARWYYDEGPDKLWQRMLEEALWPIALPWGTYRRLRGMVK